MTAVPPEGATGDAGLCTTRAAIPADAPAIAAIYNQGIADRVATFGINEFSVYVAREARGKGAGRAVLAALIEAASAHGLHKLTSRVFPENVASRALLKQSGFAEIGIHRRHGKLDGEWRDCVVVELLIGEAGQ